MTNFLHYWAVHVVWLALGFVVLTVWYGLSYQAWKSGIAQTRAASYTWMGLILGMAAISLMFHIGSLIPRDPHVLWHTLYNLGKMVLVLLWAMQFTFTLGYTLALQVGPKVHPLLAALGKVLKAYYPKNDKAPSVSATDKLAKIAAIAQRLDNAPSTKSPKR